MGATIHIDVPKFQSTPPRREVTSGSPWIQLDQIISIHTSPKGGDYPLTPVGLTVSDFNPHLPEGR